MVAIPGPGRGQLVSRALRRRCPYCGGRGFFAGWFRMNKRCANCGLLTDRVIGHWIGAVGINTIVSFGALLVVIAAGAVLTYPDFDLVKVLVAAVAVAVLVPLIVWPYSQTLWTAIDIMMRPVTSEEIDPRYEDEVRSRRPTR